MNKGGQEMIAVKPLTTQDLIDIECDTTLMETCGRTVQILIAEIRRQRSVLDQVDASTRRVEAGLDRVAEQNTQLLTALAHLDAIIGAYDAPGIVPLLNAIRDAKAWRETVEHVG